MTITSAKKEQKQNSEININTNTETETEAETEREIYLDNKMKLEEAWKEVDDERQKINRLDIEIANLKDVNTKLEQINQNILKSFQDLYSQYQQLYDQVVSSNTALSITTGKLAESLVRFKFTLPQAEQQQT